MSSSIHPSVSTSCSYRVVTNLPLLFSASKSKISSYLSIYPSFYLSIYLSIFLSIYLSNYLSAYMSRPAAAIVSCTNLSHLLPVVESMGRANVMSTWKLDPARSVSSGANPNSICLSILQPACWALLASCSTHFEYFLVVRCLRTYLYMDLWNFLILSLSRAFLIFLRKIYQGRQGECLR